MQPEQVLIPALSCPRAPWAAAARVNPCTLWNKLGYFLHRQRMAKPVRGICCLSGNPLH